MRTLWKESLSLKPLKDFFEREGTQTQKNFLTDENVIMLQLLLCLLKKVNYCTKYFQGENLNILDVSRKLKQVAVSFGEYLFESRIQNNNSKDFRDWKESYKEIEVKIRMESDECLEYIEGMRDDEGFQEYFIQENTEFETVLQADEEFEEEFFTSASDFCYKVFQQIRKRICWNEENSILDSDCFLLKEKSSLSKLRSLATRFSNVIHPDRLTDFNLEVTRLESDAKFISKSIETCDHFLDAWFKEKQSYPLVYTLARAIQVLPYSSASTE